MARIALVTSSPPLIEGGHLVIARALAQALAEAGHEAGLVITPQNRFGRLASTYLAARLTDVGVGGDGRPVDQVISLRYPSYAVRHPRHVCWLNHTMREYYDQWERFRASLSGRGRLKEGVRRRLVHAVDRFLLTRNVTRLFVISGTVQGRLRRWGGIPAEVIYPPPPPRPYRTDEYGDYVFVASRLTRLKRIDLVIRALARREAAGLRLVIGGEGEERESLRTLAASLGVGDRVRLAGRLDEPQLVEHLARCRLVCFPPLDEDYGFVTVEAFAARKPVVTCADSGGPAEIVRDGVSGFVCAPEPEALAGALRRLADDRDLASRLGEAGYRAVADMRWAAVVERLLLPGVARAPEAEAGVGRGAALG